MSKQIRCALYPRVSTEEQLIHGISLEAQREDLISYADRMGYSIVGVYPDEGISARKPVSKRPALLRLLEDVKQNKIDIILVTKLDRWFRNIKEYQTTEEILRAHNCYWKTIYEDYDTSTANGQMVVNIMLAVAQNECDRTSERIKDVFAHKKRNQEHLNGPIQFGYKVVSKHLVKDENRKHIVEDVFRQYFSCYSKRSTVRYILETYKEEAPTSYQINRMLTSEVYAGMRYGKLGYCEPYITVEQHNRIINTCQSKTYPSTKEPYLFSQLILCPHCGLKLVGFVKRHKCKDGRVTETKKYRCGQKTTTPHSAPCISEKTVEAYMLEHLYSELMNRIWEIEKVQTKKPKKQKDVFKIKSEMERLTLLFQKGRITMDYYDSEYSALEKQLSDEEEEKLISIESYNNIKDKLYGNWKDVYMELDYAHRKIFWKNLIKEIYVDKETHKVCGFKFLVGGCSK